MESDYEPIRSEESNLSEDGRQQQEPSQEGEQGLLAPAEETARESSATEQTEEAGCCDPQALEKAEDSEHGVPSSEQPKNSHHNIDLGKRGEKAAAAFLERRGMEILERNWRCPAGEVDIVARDENDSLRFVEVKTRSNCEKGFPAEAVDAARRARYERIAVQYLKTYEITDIAVCFDIISIIVTGENRAFLRLHRNAFSCNDC